MTQEDNFIHKELTYKIIGYAMKVHRELGYGFLENALMVLLEEEGIKARQQYPISVYFENKVVGEYFADILVEDKVLIELKAIERTANTHTAQLLNYLKATKIRLGLLINFAPRKLEYERIIK
ncbi:MAG: GxxExxY protein [Planctomycetales bacterium 4572_13]|nr:MAG: GxxExxY protein [Planctomycetales bacterium 4572_13]